MNEVHLYTGKEKVETEDLEKVLPQLLLDF